jgi:hypothetical protein
VSFVARALMRYRSRLSAAVLTTVLALSVLMVSPVPASAVTQLPRPSGSGAYVGPGAPKALVAFGSWRGRKADFAMDYLSMRSWSEFERPWLVSQWKSTGTPVVLAVPMLMNDVSTTLGAGAAGSYDQHFRNLAQYLVANGYGNASLRIGWEFNGSWERWSAVKNPQGWVTYWRRIVKVMRSAPGQSFTFDWNLNGGSASVAPESVYPGDAYVDYIGTDAYDWRWASPGYTPQARWSWIVNQKYGLAWVANFAKLHGKRVTVPEWGLAPRWEMQNGGGGDDPYYISSMMSWQRANHVAYQSYFNWQNNIINTGRYPYGAAKYKSIIWP